LRQSLEQLPWVRRAEVWRKWPSRIEVRIEEHQAVAHWGDGQGSWSIPTARCFPPRCRASSAAAAQRPVGSSGEVLRRYEEFAQLLKPVGRLPAQVALSPRLAWLLKLEDGMLVELGREQAKAPIRMRLQRFVDYYPTLSEHPPGAADGGGYAVSKRFRIALSGSKDLIVGLDIGTSKIVALVAELTPEGRLNVIGMGSQESKG
jgi:cell division protein FtsQ